jgi:hypothetical protein
MRIHVAVLLAACSTTHLIPETTGVHTPSLRLPATTDVLEPAFPARVGEPRLPSADQLRIALRGEGIQRASADVRVCVAPSGEVTEVTLVTPTGVSTLDAAIARDLARWSYEPYRAPPTVRVCVPLAVTYLP